MTLENLERQTQTAFDLMCGLRGDQSSQAYIHAAKAWMALDAMQRKARIAAKKAAKATAPVTDITEAEVDALALMAGLPKVETPNIEPEAAAETADKAPRRGSSKAVM